jgi:translation initiation factor 2B subunit (eIF-2B alpha/beta/delta family)
VTLIADALAPSLVGEVDLVMVGGDALSPQGLINKIGTYGIALAAQRFNIKFLALLGTEKFIPFLVKSIPQMDPAELLPNPQKINVCNRYFELTPLDLIWGVICENGIIGGKQISKQLPQLQVHEALQG